MGFVYALIAAGLSLIFGLMEIVNFAHGEFLMIAMYAAFFAWALAKLDPLVSLPLTAVALAVLGWQVALGTIYWVGWLAVVALFAYEHSLVSPRDLSRLDVAFFNVNGYIALIVLASVMLGLWRPQW